MQGCGFRDVNEEFEKKNARIFGVSFDTIEENKAFAEKFSFNFPLLCDTDRSMGLAYGACKDASASNAARIGVVIAPDGTIKAFETKADVKTYPTSVYELL